jgi:hypothetical protein
MSATNRSTIEFLELGRAACAAGVDQVQGTVEDHEIPAALHAADLMEEVEMSISPELAAHLYCYDRAIEKAKAEVALKEAASAVAPG